MTGGQPSVTVRLTIDTPEDMGEFGAVSVVSGHIRGETNSMPLHVEILYNEYNFAAAFAVASLLAILALLTLLIKTFVEWKANKVNLELKED